MRDYVAWHRSYDDPTSSVSWRLRQVQAALSAELDRRAAPVRIVSVCAGDGRDVLGVLSSRSDAHRVTATLVELHPEIVEAARTAAASLPGVEVRQADAGVTDAYLGAVPADILLLVGVFGNISDDDVRRLVQAVPGLCADGALIIWSRGIRIDYSGVSPHLNDAVRRWFADASCRELTYEIHDGGSSDSAALGTVRFVGAPEELPPARPLFTFVR